MSAPRTHPAAGLIVIAAVAVLAGCAAPAEMESMVAAQPVAAAPKDASLVGGIYVAEVAGGESTNPLWTSEVGNTEFGGALRKSLRAHGVLSEDASGSPYLLKANLLGLEQPAFGLDMTVTSHVNYEVTRRADSQLYLGETVNTSYTATAGQAFLGVERLRLANEGAIRQNIKDFLLRLFDQSPR